jgi:hypothetical protein
MNYPALIFWVLITSTIMASPETVLIMLVASIPFASIALLPPEIVGGLTLLPQSVFVVVLLVKVLSQQVTVGPARIFSALHLDNLGYLALFLLVGIVATVIMPRLFLGDVVVIPMKEAWKADLVTPIQANFTQSGYVALSVMTAFAIILIADKATFAETFLTSLLVGGVICIATGLIDAAAAATGMGKFLDPFRNAGYAYITSAELGGLRRIIGLTPEASSYGGMCIAFATPLALLRTLYAEGRQRIIATTVTLGLVVMAVLSTSSTAYGGLAVLGLTYAANWIRRVTIGSTLGKSGLGGELVMGLGLVVVSLIILVFDADFFDPLVNLIGEVIFDKPLTSSFYERSHWNSVAWDAFTSTWGLGIGFGSTRTSNWFAALVSSTGLLGTALMGIFLIRLLTKRGSWPSPLFVEMLPGLKLSLFPILAMAYVSSGGADFGLWVGVIFGAIAGLAEYSPRRGSVSPDVAEKMVPAGVGGSRRLWHGR